MSAIAVVHFDGVPARTSGEYGSIPYHDGVDLWKRLSLDRPALITHDSEDSQRVQEFCALMRLDYMWSLSVLVRGEEYVDIVTGFVGKQRSSIGFVLTARSVDAVSASARGLAALVYVKPTANASRVPSGQGAWATTYDPERDSAWAFVDALNETDDEDDFVEEELP